MKGKCYRCGSPDHMANNCTVAKDIKCKRCNGTGHTQSSCVASGQATATDDRSPPNSQNIQNNPSLALEYQPENIAQANYAMAFADWGDHRSFPTPPALL